MPVIRPYESRMNPGVATEQTRATPQAFGAGVAEAIGGVERTALAIRDQERQREQQDQLAATNVELAQTEADIALEAARLRETAAPEGAGHADAALAAFDARADAIKAKIKDPDVARQTGVHLAQARGRLQVSEGGWEAGRKANALVTNIQTAVDIDRSTLTAKPDKALFVDAMARHKAVIDGMGLDAETREKLWTETRQGLGLSFGQGLAERNPYAAVQAINSGYFTGIIDPDKLAALKNRADTEIRGIEAAQRQAEAQARAEARAAETARRQAESDAKREIGERIADHVDYVRNGGIMTPEQHRQFVTAAEQIGRPELARTVNELGIASNVNVALRGAPPVAIQAEVNALQAKVNAAGASASNDDLVALRAARAFEAKARTEIAADPLNWAQQQGVVALAPLNPADPKSMAARIAATDVVRARYGATGPLTRAEVGQLRSTLARGSADERLSVLQGLSGLGKYRAAAMRQLSKDDPVHGHVGLLLAARGGALTARDAINGLALKTSNPDLVAGNTKASALADIMPALSALPDVQAALPMVADGIYATRRTRAGESGWDERDYIGAVNAALGAYRDQNGVQRGGIGEYRKAAILLPEDVSQEAFDDAIEAYQVPAKGGPVDRDGRPVSAATLKAMPLVSLGNGRYGFANDPQRRSLVARADGSPFVMIVGQRGQP